MISKEHQIKVQSLPLCTNREDEGEFKNPCTIILHIVVERIVYGESDSRLFAPEPNFFTEHKTDLTEKSICLASFSVPVKCKPVFQ